MGQPLERLIEGYRASGLNKEANDLAKDLARFRKNPGFPEELSTKSSSQQSFRKESLPTPEQLVLRPRFTPLEVERLVGDEGKEFVLSGTTVPQQRKARGDKPSFWHVVGSLDNLPSRAGQEVVIFPKPERFFVPGTFGKDTDTQEILLRTAGNSLADRLNLKNPEGKPTIAVIIADEAATWSDLTFQYLGDPENKNGLWLFGPEYAEAQGKPWVHGRTKNKTDASGSYVADVGSARPVGGLRVRDWRRGHGDDSVGAPFLVVPIEPQ